MPGIRAQQGHQGAGGSRLAGAVDIQAERLCELAVAVADKELEPDSALTEVHEQVTGCWITRGLPDTVLHVTLVAYLRLWLQSPDAGRGGRDVLVVMRCDLGGLG